MTRKIYTVIGLMSGTSMDGVDVACIKTDGHDFVQSVENTFFPYDDELREVVTQSLGISDRNDPRVLKAEKIITEAHINAVKDFHRKADLIGFHGQTTFHDPANRLTIQVGDGQALANASKMDVVYDFRTADVLSGGQGAPFLPLYHQVLARSANIPLPSIVLNIGGVGNITYIGKDENEVVAFDTGPGNALIDDWVFEKTGRTYDESGKLAQTGKVDESSLQKLLDNPYFDAPVPKSLDRNEFSREAINDLSLEDGAATLAMFTVQSILKNLDHLPSRPKAIYVTGGGRKNNFIMKQLAEKSGILIKSVDELGWNGDAIEAEGFAYLAVRSILGLYLSLPTTTGCPEPITGGRLVHPQLGS